MCRRWFHSVGVATAIAVAILSTSSTARADELADVQAFISGRSELASVAGKAVTKITAGTYRIELPTGATKLYITKAGGAWAAAVTFDRQGFDLGALIPTSVLGDAKVSDLAIVIATGEGTLDGAPIGLRDAGKVPLVAGANFVARFSTGKTGTLGLLATAGVIPTQPIVITGTIGGGAVEAALAGKAPSLAALDFSLTAKTSSFTPAPFSLIASPKLTFGDGALTFARTSGAFTLSGEQTNSKFVVGQHTFAIPRTKLVFTAAGGGYDVSIEGWSTEPWREAFGIERMTVNAIGVIGTVSAQPTANGSTRIKGFGLGLAAKVSINRRDYEGQFSVLVENNALKELSLALGGELSLDFLPRGKDFTFKKFELAFTPGSQQVAIAGELQWRTFNTRAAVVMSKEPFLLLGLKGLDLGMLLPKPPQGVPLPTLDVLLTFGFAANNGDVTNLPSVAQELVDEFAGANSKIRIANGFGIVTRTDAKRLGVEALGVKGALLLAGSIDLQKGSFRLAASLPSLPAIPGLPAGFGIESPEVFVAVEQKGGAAVPSIGLGLRLLLPADKQQLAFKGTMAVSGAGTFAFTGAMETNWVNPFGLDGLTILAPVVVTVGVGADASVDLGIQAGMKIAKQTYNPMAMCVNLQAGVPPVPKKLAIKFKGSELGPKVELEILEALVKSVIDGPLKNAAVDPATQKALAAVRPGVDKIGNAADGFGIAAFSLKNVDFALTTPGVTCDLPAISGMGIKVAGSANYLGKPIGTLDSFANLTEGFKIDTSIADIELFNVLKLSGVRFDLLAPMPGLPVARSAADAAKADALAARLAKMKRSLAARNKAIKREKNFKTRAELTQDRDDLEADIARLDKKVKRLSGPDYGHFYVTGKTEIAGSSAAVKIAIDKLGAEFGFKADLADFGKLSLSAATVGENITKVTDFKVGLGVSDINDKLVAKLGAALKASAAKRKQLESSVTQGTDAAIKAAQDEYDRLDATAGRDFRNAKADLKAANRKLRKAERALDNAKDDCEEALSVFSDLCDVVDTAKGAVKVAESAVERSEDALSAIKKSTDYLRLQTLDTTLATLKAGKDLAAAGLAGWAAVDSIGQKVVDGAASDLISFDEIELQASLRTLRGKLDVTVGVGDTDIERSFAIGIGPGTLDITELADEVADEISKQAIEKDSAVWKVLRRKK